MIPLTKDTVLHFEALGSYHVTIGNMDNKKAGEQILKNQEKAKKFDEITGFMELEGQPLFDLYKAYLKKLEGKND